MGRIDKAERLLGASPIEVAEASRAGQRLSPWLSETAAGFGGEARDGHRQRHLGQRRDRAL
jgi:hypothetical protein